MKSSPTSIRVLHVDDEPDLTDMVAAFLKKENDRFEVASATNVDDGLSRLIDEEFDCVVSDYDMPGQNGIEFLETVREKYSDLPFILFTGKGSEEIASVAISAGVTDYLQKQTGTSQYTVLANRITNAVENHRTQIKLTDREQRLNLFFEQSPLGVIEWDEQFTFVQLNEAAEEILGYAEDDLVGRSWKVIVPESNQKAVDDVVGGLLENEGGYYSLNENIRGDGERIVCEWHNRVVTDDDGVVAVFSQFHDVTERREQKQRLKAIIDNLPGYVYRHGLEPEWPLEFAGGASQQITGYTPAELVSEITLAETVIHPADREGVRNGVEEGLEADGRYDLSYRITTKSGEQRWVRDRGRTIADPITGVEKLEGLITDIIDRVAQKQNLKQRTDELRDVSSQLKDQYRNLFEEAPIMIVETRSKDGEPIIADCNQRSSRQ